MHQHIQASKPNQRPPSPAPSLSNTYQFASSLVMQRTTAPYESQAALSVSSSPHVPLQDMAFMYCTREAGQVQGLGHRGCARVRHKLHNISPVQVPNAAHTRSRATGPVASLLMRVPVSAWEHHPRSPC